MPKIIPPKGDSQSLSNDLFGEIVWPHDVIERAREAVIRDGYAPGAEESVRAGKFDRWEVIRIACHAICDDPARKVIEPPKPAPIPIPRVLTFEEKLEARARELETQMLGRASDIERELNDK